jgi:hypothetical protein
MGMPVSSLENEMTGNVLGIRTPQQHEYPTRPAGLAEKRMGLALRAEIFLTVLCMRSVSLKEDPR